MEEVNTINNIASENVDFSMFALFMSADLVVKSVIIILILASIYSWTIIVSKLLRLISIGLLAKKIYVLEVFVSVITENSFFEFLRLIISCKILSCIRKFF